MSNTMQLELEELTDNPTARLPVCLVLDTSGSMAGKPIVELNRGVHLFFSAINEDEVAKYSAEISIITFGSSIEKIMDFHTADNQESVPTLRANGMTPMGEAVTKALVILDERKQKYSRAGVDYYQPWLVLMTDGVPTDDIQSVARQTCTLVNNKKLTLFPIGIGARADLEILEKFSPKWQPLRLQGLKFQEFFQWLSQSVSQTSQSIPGEKMVIDMSGIKGWGEL